MNNATYLDESVTVCTLTDDGHGNDYARVEFSDGRREWVYAEDLD